MDQGGSVHTTEISRYYKSGFCFLFFFLKSPLQHHDYLLRLYSYDLEIILELTPTKINMVFFPGSDGKESACNAGDLGLNPGSERSPGENQYTERGDWPKWLKWWEHLYHTEDKFQSGKNFTLVVFSLRGRRTPSRGLCLGANGLGNLQVQVWCQRQVSGYHGALPHVFLNKVLESKHAAQEPTSLQELRKATWNVCSFP